MPVLLCSLWSGRQHHASYSQSPWPEELKMYFVEEANEGRLVYRCTLCDKLFTVCSNARRHIRSKHLGQRYRCPMCPGVFDRVDTLNLHKRKVHPQRINSEDK